jgi:hypothetical protein
MKSPIAEEPVGALEPSPRDLDVLLITEKYFEGDGADVGAQTP